MKIKLTIISLGLAVCFLFNAGEVLANDPPQSYYEALQTKLTVCRWGGSGYGISTMGGNHASSPYREAYYYYHSGSPIFYTGGTAGGKYVDMFSPKDIIPPNGTNIGYNPNISPALQNIGFSPGVQNWTASGQKIWNNSCQVPYKSNYNNGWKAPTGKGKYFNTNYDSGYNNGWNNGYNNNWKAPVK